MASQLSIYIGDEAVYLWELYEMLRDSEYLAHLGDEEIWLLAGQMVRRLYEKEPE